MGRHTVHRPGMGDVETDRKALADEAAADAVKRGCRATVTTHQADTADDLAADAADAEHAADVAVVTKAVKARKARK